MGKCASAEDNANLAASGLLELDWVELLPMTPLGPGYKGESIFDFAAVVPDAHPQAWTHIRVNMFPDGGIARLRCYGQVKVNWDMMPHGAHVDLASVKTGGRALMWSDTHYGHPGLILNPGRGVDMGDGWETARQTDRDPVLHPVNEGGGLLGLKGSEWAVFELGAHGMVFEVELDTAHFKGNFPESVRVDGCFVDAGEVRTAEALEDKWFPLLERVKLGPDAIHTFTVHPSNPCSHVRLTMFPDGGISRFRVWGNPLSRLPPLPKL